MLLPCGGGGGGGGALLGTRQVPGFCASPFQEPLQPRGIKGGLPSKGPRAGVPTKDSERPRLWEAGVRNVSSVFTCSLIL